MNHIYRVVWNASLAVWQAVSEIGKGASKGKSHARRHRASLSVLAGSLFLVSAQVYSAALPTNGTVSLGAGSISQNGSVMNITQSTNKMAIDWQSFSIGQGNTVNFVQPSASAIALNRVTGTDVSSIQGAINANGQVFLINPNGILFSTTAQVNVGGLVASTRNLTNDNFSAGNYKFEGSNGNAVVNQGKIVATDGGYVVMVAAKIENYGSITANAGSLHLAAGDTVMVNMGGAVNVEVKQGAIDALIKNGGAIKADGGHILLTAKAAGDLAASVINNTGIVEATSMTAKGGEIVFSGDNITNSGTVTADGATGGGKVLVGGDWQGSNAAVTPHATKVTLTETSNISANATTQGDGGKVVVWSDIKNKNSETKVAGTLSAKGKGANAKGGQIETSGHVLNVTKDTSVTAGEWLLDPTDITISSGSGGSLTNDATSSDVGADTITTALNLGTSVTVQTDSAQSGDGNITVAGSIEKTAGGAATLTLSAANDITINSDVSISSTTGALTTVLRADNDGNSTGSILMNANSSITTNGGALFLVGGTGSGRAQTINTGSLTLGAGNLTLVSAGNVSLGAVSTTGEIWLDANGAVTQTGALTGATLKLYGTTGTYTLTNTSNAINTVIAQTGSVNLVNATALGTGAITTTGALTLSTQTGNLTVTDNITSSSTVLLTAAGDIAVNSTKTITAPTSITLYGTNITNSGTLDVSTSTAFTNGGTIALAKDASTAATSITLGAINASSTTSGNGGVISATGTTVNVTGTVDASAATGNGGAITIAGNAAGTTAADFIDLAGTLNASATTGTGGTIITNASSVRLGSSANVTTIGTANDAAKIGTWKTPTSTFETVVGENGDYTGEELSTLLKTGSVTIDTATKFALSNTLLGQNNLVSVTTNNAITSASFGNIVINDAITKVSAGRWGTEENPGNDKSLDTTLTIIAPNDITINSAITSNVQRLNLVLNANSDNLNGGDVIFMANGSVATNGGNFYVGTVTEGIATNGQTYAYDNSYSAYHDSVTASANNFTMMSGSQINVGDGSLVVKVLNDITLPTDVATGKTFSIYSTAGSSGYNNATETNRYRSSDNYSSEQIAVVPTSLTLEAGRHITGASSDSTKIVTTNSSADVHITSTGGDIGADTTPMLLKSSYGTLNVTNTLGNSYLKFANANEDYNFITVNLTTTATTVGKTQKIEFNSDGSHKLLATTGANGLLTIATDGLIDASTNKNLVIQAPNITLENGAIVATGGSSSATSDPAVLSGTGLNLTLRALSGSDYGEIKADNAADNYSSSAAPTDHSNQEIYNQYGTINLDAKNIGVTQGGSVAWENALELTAVSLNVFNRGGSTWIRNSDYNTVTFAAVDANATEVGQHHIMSTNGDFFNIETTASAQTIIHTIDNVDKMSGIKTTNRNVSLTTGTGTQSRDIIMADNAIDIGAATLSLTAYNGKSVLAYSTNHPQDSGNPITAATYTNATTPTITAGNLNLTIQNGNGVGSIGGSGYSLKVAKGGTTDQVNVGNNTLNITNDSGDISIKELSANYLKNINITYPNRDSSAHAHTVAIDLFDNNTTENVNYSGAGTGNGLLTLNAAGIALAGFNRNFSLYAYYKDIQIGNASSSGPVGFNGGSGNYSVQSYSNSILLDGNVYTNGGNIALTADTFKLLSTTRIDSNADDASNSTSTGAAGSITLQSSGYQGANVSANTTGVSLELDATSSVAGGTITTDLNATNSAGAYLSGLSFISSGATAAQDGYVRLYGASYALNGNFIATGKVALSGGESTSSAYNVPGVSIDTNQVGSGTSGNISFSGYSLSGNLNLNYTFDTRSSGTGGNVSLYPASTTGTFAAGSMTVVTTGSGAGTTGTIELPAVTTYKNIYSYDTSSAQSYTGSAITLHGNLQSNMGNITLSAPSITLASDVVIDTFDYGSSAMGYTAGNVSIAAPITTAQAGLSFLIDASAVGNTSNPPTHGSVSIVDASTDVSFLNFGLIGGAITGYNPNNSHYKPINQLTYGQMNGGNFTFTALDVPKLLLLGSTNYTVTNSTISTLAALGVGNLSVTTNNALTVGSLSYVNGISATGTVNIATSTGDLTVTGPIATTNTTTSAITLNAGSTAAAGTVAGGNVVWSGGSLSVGSGGRATVYTGSVADSGSYNFGAGHYRYNSDETTSNFSTALSTGSYAIYRERPIITVSTDIALTREYNGQTVTPSNSNFTYTGLVNGDLVSSITGSGSLGWSVGNGAVLKNAGSYTLSAVGSLSNELGYAISALPSNLSYTITPITLVASIVGTPSKVYDANTDATLESSNYSIANLVSGESFTVTKTTGAYNSKDVATANSVTTSLISTDFTAAEGTLASNYVMPTTATGDASITRKEISFALLGQTKVYDGSTAAVLSDSAIVNPIDLAGNEGINITKRLGAYNDKNVADAEMVTLSLASADFALTGGADLGNYNINGAGEQVPSTIVGDGTITLRSLVAIAKSQDKIFDAKTNAKTTLTIAPENANLREMNLNTNPLIVNGVVGNEQVHLTFTDANFSDEKVGTNKTVTINGLAVAGVDAANYMVMYRDATGHLTAPADTMETIASIHPFNPPVFNPPATPPVAVVIPQLNLGNAPVASIGGMQVVAVQSSNAVSSGGSTTSLNSGSQGGNAMDTVLLTQANSSSASGNQVFVVDGGVNVTRADSQSEQ
jgi:filamentous hemagglutinin family protein